MSPSCLRLAAFLTTSQRTGWELPPDGALVAASSILSRSASDTSRAASSRRMALVVAMASNTSTSAPDPLEPHDRDGPVGALLVGVVEAPGVPGQVPQALPLVVVDGGGAHGYQGALHLDLGLGLGLEVQVPVRMQPGPAVGGDHDEVGPVGHVVQRGDALFGRLAPDGVEQEEPGLAQATEDPTLAQAVRGGVHGGEEL